jgi:hypothetical protein
VQQENKWDGRSLENYKESNKAKAEAEGKLDQLMRCTTLTQAKEVLWGKKEKRAREGGGVKKVRAVEG